MSAPAVTLVALFEVPSEPRPFRVGWAAENALLAISGEFADLSDAFDFAHELSAASGLPIEARLRPRVFH